MTVAANSFGVDYEICDADQHYYEPVDCLTRHLEPQHQRIVKWATIGGRDTILIHGKQWASVPNPTYDPVAVPGVFEQYFRAENHAGTELRDMVVMQPLQPEYRNRDLRVQRLDEQGVARTWLIPSLGLAVEEMVQQDIESGMAIVRAYNRWLEEDWGYRRDERINTGPLLSLLDPELAEQELDRVMAIGTNMVILRAGPVPSPHALRRSPADKVYDRIWAKLAEAGIVVAIHAGDSGTSKYLGDYGEPIGYQGSKMGPLTELMGLSTDRPIYDMMAALIAHGLFDRHPALKVATLELGSGWAVELHRKLRTSYGKTPQAYRRDPVESFREHVWIAPFYEDSIVRLRDCHGADRILLGSDWPHPEGLARPIDWAGDFVELGPADMRKSLRDNFLQLTAA